MTGTFWHSYVAETLVKSGIPFMQEVKLTPWLPEGWSGTADWIFWHPEYQAFVLGDLKTIKGEGLRFVEQGGAKKEHHWQLSAYWYALQNMGLPLLKGFAVLYLPKNNVPEKESIEPIVQELDPVPWDELSDVMSARWLSTKAYLASGELPVSNASTAYGMGLVDLDAWLTPELAPEQEREQKVWWSSKTNTFDLKLVPHWSAKYCPYPNELCACSEQGSTKIGHWAYWEGPGEPEFPDRWVYYPRRGYEDIVPTVEPSDFDFAKRRKELFAKHP